MLRTGTVLVVTPQLSVRAVVCAAAASIGTMSVKSCASPADALRDLLKAPKLPDIAIVELALDDDAALQASQALCRHLAQGNAGAAVMVLTPNAAEAHVVGALQAGARDVICLPLRTAELAARLRVLVRSQLRQSHASYQIGAYILRPSENLLYTRDLERSVQLTDKEVDMIRVLYQAEGSVILKRQLLQQVWNYCPQTDTHTLETHMYRLRLKFNALAPRRQPIQTVGGGYRIGPAAETDSPHARSGLRWPRRGSEVAAWAEAARLAEGRSGVALSGD